MYIFQIHVNIKKIKVEKFRLKKSNKTLMFLDFCNIGRPNTFNLLTNPYVKQQC